MLDEERRRAQMQLGSAAAASAAASQAKSEAASLGVQRRNLQVDPPLVQHAPLTGRQCGAAHT